MLKKTKTLTLKAIRTYGNSTEDILLGRYSYTNPGPCGQNILEYVERYNEKLRKEGCKNKDLIICYISKTDRETCTIVFKSKHKHQLLNVINNCLTHSDILKYFNVDVK